MKIGDRGVMARSIPNLPDRETLLGLYEGMMLLRRFESVAQIACREGETPGFLHLYIGEEATGVGVCAHLRPTDWVTSTHRGHGHALAKGADPRRLMAELFGKARRHAAAAAAARCISTTARSASSAPTASSAPASAMRSAIGMAARAQGTRRHRRRLLRRRRRRTTAASTRR